MKNQTLKVLEVRLNTDGNYTLITLPSVFISRGTSALSMQHVSTINLVITPDTLENLTLALHKSSPSELVGKNLLYVPDIKDMFGAFVSLEGQFIDDIDVSYYLEIISISENEGETVTLQIADGQHFYNYICPKSIISKLKQIASIELIGQQPLMNLQNKQLYTLVPFPVSNFS